MRICFLLIQRLYIRAVKTNFNMFQMTRSHCVLIRCIRFIIQCNWLYWHVTDNIYHTHIYYIPPRTKVLPFWLNIYEVKLYSSLASTLCIYNLSSASNWAHTVNIKLPDSWKHASLLTVVWELAIVMIMENIILSPCSLKNKFCREFDLWAGTLTTQNIHRFLGEKKYLYNKKFK